MPRQLPHSDLVLRRPVHHVLRARDLGTAPDTPGAPDIERLLWWDTAAVVARGAEVRHHEVLTRDPKDGVSWLLCLLFQCYYPGDNDRIICAIITSSSQ